MRWVLAVVAVAGVMALGEARAQPVDPDPEPQPPAPEPDVQPLPDAQPEEPEPQPETQPEAQPEAQPQAQPEPPGPPPGYGYPGWGYGYGGYPYRPPQPPKKLPYQEGEPAPYGYHFDTQLRKGLIIAGATTFGATYLLSVAVGAAFQDDNDAERFAPLFIPVVGPFISVGTADPVAFATFLLVLDGLSQTFGVGMFIAGVTDREKIWVRNDLALRVRPLIGPGIAGAGLTAEL